LVCAAAVVHASFNAFRPACIRSAGRSHSCTAHMRARSDSSTGPGRFNAPTSVPTAVARFLR
jgi:hypothetical protein